MKIRTPYDIYYQIMAENFENKIRDCLYEEKTKYYFYEDEDPEMFTFLKNRKNYLATRGYTVTEDNPGEIRVGINTCGIKKMLALAKNIKENKPLEKKKGFLKGFLTWGK